MFEKSNVSVKGGKLFEWFSFLSFACLSPFTFKKRCHMKLQESLIKKLSQTYESSAMFNLRFRENDVAFKTDDKGNPVFMFIGKKGADGKVKGVRYSRTLIYDKDGNKIKDHWDRKGKTS